MNELKDIENGKRLVALRLGEETVNGIIKENNLHVGDKVVVAKEGTFLSSGEMVKETHINDLLVNVHICTGFELGIKDIKEILILDNDAKAGEDFFLVEER